MPELPEVETTRRGIAPFVDGQTVTALTVRQPRLRWPVPVRSLKKHLVGAVIERVERRAKYLLLRSTRGTAIIHLGMSGSLRVLTAPAAAARHDHVDIFLGNGYLLRLTDPRRFGALLWTTDDPLHHELLRSLGPEPLDDSFNGNHLYTLSRGRRLAIKPFIMDSHTVSGVGNIYANEALFMAGIHPTRAAGRISQARLARLAETIKQVLGESIKQGGTTLRDFVNGEGKPGYFSLYLRVYGRGGEPCPTCASPIREIRQGQRATFYCSHCQH